MMKLLILLVCLIQFNTYAQSIGIATDDLYHYESLTELENSFVKAGFKTPEGLQVKLKRIKKLSYGEGRKTKSSFQLPEFKLNGTRLDPKLILPENIMDLIGTYTSKDGPNCFNTALNYFSETQWIQYTPGIQMEIAIEQLFEPIENGSQLKISDLVVVYSNNDIKHTAVYVGGDVLFEKATALKDTPYVFTTLKESLRPYLLRKGLQERREVRFFRFKGEKKITLHDVNRVLWGL